MANNRLENIQVTRSANSNDDMHIVNWNNKTCSCGAFQNCKFPCIHAAAVLSKFILKNNSSAEAYQNEVKQLLGPNYQLSSMINLWNGSEILISSVSTANVTAARSI